MAVSARRVASASAAWAATRSRSSTTSISRPSAAASRWSSVAVQPASAPPYSQPERNRAPSRTAISSGRAEGTGLRSTRTGAEPAARPTPRAMLASWASGPAPSSTAEAAAATISASRSRICASRARSSACVRRARAWLASRPTTTATMPNTTSVATFSEFEIVSWWRGALKK